MSCGIVIVCKRSSEHISTSVTMIYFIVASYLANSTFTALQSNSLVVYETSVRHCNHSVAITASCELFANILLDLCTDHLLWTERVLDCFKLRQTYIQYT